MSKRIKIYLAVLFVGWCLSHISLLLYGSNNVPLHISYVGDEQAPVNGALHILNDKNPFALRNLRTVYYGPLFSMVALPGIIWDFGEKVITGEVHSSQEYKESILFNWGGIIWKDRVTALLFGFLGIFFLAKLLTTKTINPSQKDFPVYLGTLLLFFNFYYFEYGAFFKHWVFIISTAIIQYYLLIRLEESGYKKKYWVWSAILFAFGFGISYVSAFFQVMWTPLLIKWLKERNTREIKMFIYYILAILVAISVIVAWHPHAFRRLLGMVGGDITGTSIAQYTSEQQYKGFSFVYYGSIIVTNSFPLLLLWVTLCFTKVRLLYKKWWTWSSLAPALVYFIIFGCISDHESRYVLPTLILFLVHIVTLFVYYLSQYSQEDNRLIKITAITLCTFTIVFNAVHIRQFMSIYSDGPIEKQVISQILNIQGTNDRILMVNSYILGHIHTPEAYRDYTKNTNKENINLYKEIMKTPLPQDLTPLNVYYALPTDFDKNPGISREYNHVIMQYRPRVEINQFDFFDENILRLWNYYDYSPHYFFLK